MQLEKKYTIVSGVGAYRECGVLIRIFIDRPSETLILFAYPILCSVIILQSLTTISKRA